MSDNSIVPYRTFLFSQQQRRCFRDGSLMRSWARTYPELFDSDDVRIAAAQPQYHFFEWLAAILLCHTEGYLSLVEQYEFECHKRKQETLKRILGNSPVLDLVLSRDKGAQCPDLFAYKPDGSHWFFAEVKGTGDHVRSAPARLFAALSQITGDPVRLITFGPLADSLAVHLCIAPKR